MKGKFAIILTLLTSLTLQGCKSSSENGQSIHESAPMENTPPSQLSFLKQCLNNADELVKLNSKYKSTQSEIHFLINEAKSYSSFSDNTSDNVKK